MEFQLTSSFVSIVVTFGGIHNVHDGNELMVVLM